MSAAGTASGEDRRLFAAVLRRSLRDRPRLFRPRIRRNMMMGPTFAPVPALELPGLYLPLLMLWAGLALVSFVAPRWLLGRTGLYRFVWHRPLLNLALYVLLVGGALLRGKVQGASRAIAGPTETSGGLLTAVEPNFERIRLARRIPVRMTLDKIPADVDLVSGLSATVTIHPATGGR